jgi:glycosyltransferase involved in cell wall biosynthesis
VFSGGILPTKLMEYAALGIPAIAARTTGIAAYFDETMVQFFTPDDVEGLAHCILTLHADRERLAQLAKGSGKFIECYNWTRLGAEYAALVKQLSKQ